MSKAKYSLKILKDLNSSSFAGLKARVATLNDKVVLVGLPDKQHKSSADGEAVSVAFVGAVHEFGSPDNNIPERPWLRPGIRAARDMLVRLNRINLIKIIHGTMNAATALRQMGALAQGSVQRYIRTGHFAPLKPATIRAKGSSKPLIDTGQMVQSVTYQVADKAEAKNGI